MPVPATAGLEPSSAYGPQETVPKKESVSEESVRSAVELRGRKRYSISESSTRIRLGIE